MRLTPSDGPNACKRARLFQPLERVLDSLSNQIGRIMCNAELTTLELLPIHLEVPFIVLMPLLMVVVVFALIKQVNLIIVLVIVNCSPCLVLVNICLPILLKLLTVALRLCKLVFSIAIFMDLFHPVTSLPTTGFPHFALEILLTAVPTTLSWPCLTRLLTVHTPLLMEKMFVEQSAVFTAI
jgi:hypothetical protein